MREGADTRNPGGSDARNVANVLLWLVVVHAGTLEVFLRKPGTCGSRYNMTPRFLALFYIPLFTALTVETVQAAEVMKWFFIAYVVMCLIDRLQGLRARRRGYCVHSHYIGDCRTKYESVLCLLLAAAALMFGTAGFVLAAYLFVGSFCLAFLEDYRNRRDQAHAQAMIDAEWEQQNFAQRYSRMKGGEFDR